MKKEELIRAYHNIEQEKKWVKEKMDKNPSLSKLRLLLEDTKHQLDVEEWGYKEDIAIYDKRLQVIKEDLMAGWDIAGKSFKCGAGSATIRTTRSLEIDNKAKLIGILQEIGKLEVCIKSWDLTYLRKLADADLFEGFGVMHYNEKKSVVIGDVKK